MFNKWEIISPLGVIKYWGLNRNFEWPSSSQYDNGILWELKTHYTKQAYSIVALIKRKKKKMPNLKDANFIFKKNTQKKKKKSFMIWFEENYQKYQIWLNIYGMENMAIDLILRIKWQLGINKMKNMKCLYF